MRFKTKVAILLLAILLTFTIFNLLVPAAAVDLAKAGKLAGYDIISNVITGGGKTASPSSTSGG
ncbi:MAG: hypothetical protein ACE5LC_00890 [Candidatus Aminicenantales bacterium]